MDAETGARPLLVTILTALQAILGVGGIFGGIGFLSDPSGALLGLTSATLQGLPIHDYVVPGLILLLVFGVAPLLVAYGLWKRPAWSWVGGLARWTHRH